MQCLEIFEGKCPKIPPWLHACLQVFKKDLWLVRFNPWSLSSASLVSATNSVCSAPRFGAYACIIHGGQPNNLKFNMPTLSPGVIHSLTKLSIWVKSCNPLTVKYLLAQRRSRSVTTNRLAPAIESPAALSKRYQQNRGNIVWLSWPVCAQFL